MDGLSIFTEDIPEVETLPRPKVLDYLLRHHKKLVVPYLVCIQNKLTVSVNIYFHFSQQAQLYD